MLAKPRAKANTKNNLIKKRIRNSKKELEKGFLVKTVQKPPKKLYT